MRQAVFAIALLACAATLAGCLPVSKVPRPGREDVRAEARWQRELLVRERIKLMGRMQRVALSIRESNLELCGNRVGYGAGFRLIGLKGIKDETWRKAWAAVLGPEERLKALTVVESGPAWNAGVRPGDVVLAVGNATVPEDPRWIPDAKRMILDVVERGDLLTLTLEREGESFEAEIVPALQCFYPISLDRIEDVNAFADGEMIFVNMGMIRFADKDEELATIIGHELAHNVMGHIPKKEMHFTLAEILDGLVDGVGFSLFPSTVFQDMVYGPLSVEEEYEADYVGLYMAARAGYDVSCMPDFWRRMSIHSDRPEAIVTDSTHPAYAKRAAALEATIQEIEAKKRAGQALWPELKTHMYEELVEAAKKKIERLKKRIERKDD